MNPQTVTHLFDQGVLLGLLILAVISAPFLWRFFENRVWKSGELRRAAEFDRFNKKDDNLLELTKTVAELAGSTREVVREANVRMKGVEETLDRFNSLLDRFIDRDEQRIKAEEERRRYLDNQFDYIVSELRQQGQIIRSADNANLRKKAA